MICVTCGDFVLARSRTPDLCRVCEASHIQQAAKEKDEKAMDLAALAGWVLTGQRPHRYRRAWRAE